MATIESEPRVVDITVGGTVNAVLEFIRVNMVCDLSPTVRPITSGLSIVSPPEGGLPTDIGKLLIEFGFKPDCKLFGVIPQPFPQLERIFPLPVEVTIAGVTATMSINGPTLGAYDFTSNVMNLIRNGTINENTETIGIEVKYPTKKTYNVFNPSSCTYEYATEKATVPVAIVAPPGPDIPTPIPTPGIPTPIPTPEPTGLPIICKPSLSSLTTPGSIPITLPEPTDLTSSPTLDLSTFNIVGAVSVPCVQNSSSASVPTNLFPMGMNLTIDDGKSDHTGPVTIERPGIFTEDVTRIIRDWMSTKTAAELVKLSGIKLILRYYGTVTFADASAIGVGIETKRVEKYVPLNIPTAEIPIPIPTPEPIPIPTPVTPTPTPIPIPTPEPTTTPIIPQTGLKRVYATTPLLTRSGKRTQIVGLVYCGTERVGGEKAWISINGELLTTANTRDGKVTAEWTPIVPGLYTICITVPASSACNASANGCTMMQVVSELSQADIAIAEKEFESAKKRVGELMERI